MTIMHAQRGAIQAAVRDRVAAGKGLRLGGIGWRLGIEGCGSGYSAIRECRQLHGVYIVDRC